MSESAATRIAPTGVRVHIGLVRRLVARILLLIAVMTIADHWFAWQEIVEVSWDVHFPSLMDLMGSRSVWSSVDWGTLLRRASMLGQAFMPLLEAFIAWRLWNGRMPSWLRYVSGVKG